LSDLNLEFPEKLAPLFKPARYKGAFGGRGGGKSHCFAEMVVLNCYLRAMKIVCIREVQDSIKDSVKALIEQKIDKLGLGWFFDVLGPEIRGQNDSLIVFKGMQAYNSENIKSLEGFDRAWVEEAQTLSEISLRLLRPTIRKEGSEIWFSWNPRHDTDAVDKLFRGAGKPSDAIVVEVNWNDNPWFPDVLKREKDEDYARDPEMADHVWGGNYEIVSEGAYYARLIVQAEREDRVGEFPYDPRLPVVTSWDLGVDDYTAVWFIQEDGERATVIDYYETSNEGADDIIATCLPELFIPPPLIEKFIGWSKDAALAELGRSPAFHYGQHYLPHDVRMREWGAGARSRVETVRSLGLQNIRKGAATNPMDRINAVRRILPLTRFNNTPRVEQGIKRLRRYRRKWNDTLNSYTTAMHDENSHGADAFGEYAVNCPVELPRPKKPKMAELHYLEVQPDGSVRSNMTITEIVNMKKRKRKLLEA
jgi:phage terminase large subunit